MMHILLIISVNIINLQDILSSGNQNKRNTKTQLYSGKNKVNNYKYKAHI